MIEGIYRLLFDYSYPVNLGNPDEIAVLDFAKEILNLSKINQKIDFLPLPEGIEAQPDIGLAKNIKLVPKKINRQQGILETVKYFKSIPKSKLLKVEHKNFQNTLKLR